MKLKIEGTPSEIILFLQQWQSTQQVDLQSTTAAIQSPEPVADEPEGSVAQPESHAEPLVEEVSDVRLEDAVDAVQALKSAVDAPEQADAPVQHVDKLGRTRTSYQIPVKDQIVGFLEGRRKAKVRDVAIGLSIPVKTIHPHLKELVDNGTVERTTNKALGNQFRLKAAPSSVTVKIEAPKAEVPKAEAPKAEVAPPKAVSAKKPRKNGSPVKELTVEFLRDNPNSTLLQIRTALGEQKSNTISARLVGLVKDGMVEKINREGQHSLYSLKDAKPAKQAAAKPVRESIIPPQAERATEPRPVAPARRQENQLHVDYRRIMAALVSARGASYFDLERVTGVSRGILSSRLLDMERVHLVEREGGRSSGPVTFMPKLPNSGNELPLQYGSLDEAILETLKQYSGSTAEQVSMFLVRSFADVKARVDAMNGKSIAQRGNKLFTRGWTANA